MKKPDRYSRDLENNQYPSLLRKKRWVLFFLRREQNSSNRFLKKCMCSERR